MTGGAAVRPHPGISLISTTFGGLESRSIGLAVERGPLRVNTNRPGYIDSGMRNHLSDEARPDRRRKVAAALTVRRIGSVDDVASAALFSMTNWQVTGGDFV